MSDYQNISLIRPVGHIILVMTVKRTLHCVLSRNWHMSHNENVQNRTNFYLDNN